MPLKPQVYRNNENHIVFGSDTAYRNITKSWNIFEELKTASGNYDEKESILLAKEIAKQLFEGRGSVSQPFFVRAAEDIVAKVLIHLLRTEKENTKKYRLSTEDFVTYIQQANARTYHEMLNRYDDFKSAAMYIGLKKDGSMLGGQGLGVIAEINSMVNDLFIRPFAENYDNGSISIRELVRKKQKKMIFIEYDVSVGKILEPMYRILFDLALKETLGPECK